MKRNGRRLVIGTWVLALMTFLSFHALSAERKTIIGTVSGYYQIETDEGDVYDIVENSQGNRVAEQMGSRVKATGMVEDDGSLRVINIISYTIMEEESVQDKQVEETSEENVQEEEIEEASEEDVQEEDVQEEVEENQEEDVQEEDVVETVEEDTQEEDQEESAEEDMQEEAQEETVEEDTQEEAPEEPVEENTQ